MKIQHPFFCLQHSFFNSPIGKHMAQVYQNIITFDQYLLNSRSNVHVNFVYWISLHPKKAILPIFSKNTTFISEKQKPRTSNLHYHKAGSVAVI